MSNPQDDPQTGEFSNAGRTGWRWSDTLWFALLVLVGYGPLAIVALALRGCGQ